MWLEFLRRAQERPLVRVQPSGSRDPCIVETQVLWDEHKGQQQQWSGGSRSPGYKSCVLQSVEPQKCISEDCEWIPENWT
ncbi:hypothetical protein APTSU1_001669700 [Apodemus speciosus]|uniref:Uncharacterized protein n=1 Tax=Apodemus speciosus TaxID=105296 RepID=A0ABQ0FQF2_APOSI